jgi:hypothetical protein
LKNTTIATSSSGENLVEYYNTAAPAKVSSELLEKIRPAFIFSTKEKTAHAVSSGEKWRWLDKTRFLESGKSSSLLDGLQGSS